MTIASRRLVRILVPALCAAVSMLVLAGSAALASGGAGTSIGNAENLTGTASGTLPSADADDFYVVYPQTPGATIDLTITDTTPSSPPTGCHTVVALVSDTNGSAVGSATLGSAQFQDFAVNATGSDRYFVELSDGNCNPGSGATASYQVQLTGGGGGTVPSPAASSAEPGTDIGSAGPPLQGDTSLTGTLADASQYDFYVLDKAADTGQGTIRLEDTSVHSASCRTVVALLTDTDGNAVGSATLAGNQAHTFAITAGGRYFLQLSDGDCNPGPGGPATYRVEPEPPSEFTNPPAPPTQGVSGGATRAGATPLSGGIDYTGTVAGASTQDWFASHTDQSQFILTVENTGHKSDVNGPCTTIVVLLDDADGNAVGSATLGRDQAHRFAVTGPGTFYLEITDGNCNPGTDDPPPFEIHIVDGQPPGGGPTTTTTTTTTPTTSTPTTSTTTTTAPTCGVASSERAARVSPAACPGRLPVVLVTGLADSHPGTDPSGTCAAVGSMRALCQALKQAGYPVYVVSSNADLSAGTVIVNSRGFDFNAPRLANYLATVVGRPALLVGHSMGGIFSRVAISRYHARAAGLFTIASPFDGSFGADIAEGSAHLPCPDGIAACAALHAAGAFAERHFGAAALYDLTSVARAIDNRTIAPTGLPTWTLAGTACNPFPQSAPSYLFPNDGIVGASSAYGVDANLGATTRLSAPAYHQADLQSLFAGSCGQSPIELTDPAVSSMVLRAAASLPAGAAPATGGPLARVAAAKPAATVLYLQTASLRSVKRHARVRLGTGSSLVARSRFSVRCGTRQLTALPALGGRAFGFPTGMLGCAQATITSRRAVTLGIAADSARVVARIVTNGSRLRITVSAGRPLTRLVLEHGRRHLRVAQHRHGPRSIQVSPTRAQAASLTLVATVQRRAYAATVPVQG